jgi:hypothetical protein
MRAAIAGAQKTVDEAKYCLLYIWIARKITATTVKIAIIFASKISAIMEDVH